VFYWTSGKSLELLYFIRYIYQSEFLIKLEVCSLRLKWEDNINMYVTEIGTYGGEVDSADS
jgi:hypothetical protein